LTELLLEAKQLACERDRRLLFSDLSFTLAEAELLQVEGPNGSGKTTLLRILCGLSTAFEGNVSWRGADLRKARYDYYSQSHYLGHAPGIQVSLTPEENLNWFAALAGQPHARDIQDCLRTVGLRGFEDVPCNRLSAGQRRRVALAKLLLIPATLWILDEPFAAIDKPGIILIENLLRNHLDNRGSVILTTHQDLTGISDIQKVVLG